MDIQGLKDMKSDKPIFVVFEGLDGSGKSTQIGLLAQRLRDEGRMVHVTAEPTVSTTGGLIRDALSGSYPRQTAELAGLFLADRIAHNVSPISGIRKMLDAGMDVICDRYYYSSFAYQGTPELLSWVMDMNLNCPGILKPDICVFLDIDPESCRDRMGDRTVLEIYEGSSELLNKTRRRFLSVFESLRGSENIKLVDAARDREAVAEDIFKLAAKLAGI